MGTFPGGSPKFQTGQLEGGIVNFPLRQPETPSLVERGGLLIWIPLILAGPKPLPWSKGGNANDSSNLMQCAFGRLGN